MQAHKIYNISDLIKITTKYLNQILIVLGKYVENIYFVGKHFNVY